MSEEKPKHRVKDIEKTSQKLLSMLFEMCETHISENKDEHSQKSTCVYRNGSAWSNTRLFGFDS